MKHAVLILVFINVLLADINEYGMGSWGDNEDGRSSSSSSRSCNCEVVNCSNYTTCASCSLNENCGWCTTDNTCYEGSSEGSDAQSNCSSSPNSMNSRMWSSSGNWVWSASCCPVEHNNSICNQFADCVSCASMGQCGWCGSSGKCDVGSQSGPQSNSNNCTDDNWQWEKHQCPREVEEEEELLQDHCANYSSCVQCTRVSHCGWCSSDSKCLNGELMGPINSTCDSSKNSSVDWAWFWPECEANNSNSNSNNNSNSNSNSSNSNSTSSRSRQTPPRGIPLQPIAPASNNMTNNSCESCSDSQRCYSIFQNQNDEEVMLTLEIMFNNGTEKTVNVNNYTFNYDNNHNFYFELSVSCNNSLGDYELNDMTDTLGSYCSDTTGMPRNRWRNSWRRNLYSKRFALENEDSNEEGVVLVSSLQVDYNSAASHFGISLIALVVVYTWFLML